MRRRRSAIESAQVETSREDSRVASENPAIPRGFGGGALAGANRGDRDSRVDAAPFGGFLCWRVRRFAFAKHSARQIQRRAVDWSTSHVRAL